MTVTAKLASAVSAELAKELNALDLLLEEKLREINTQGRGQGVQIFSDRMQRMGKP